MAARKPIASRTLLRTAAIILALDQFTKWVVLHRLNLAPQEVYDVWPPFLTFRVLWNRGVNFGLFAGQTDLMRWVLIAVAVIISAWVVEWARREASNRLVQLSAGLLIGGALGNVIDRLIYGAVADFLNMSCCGLSNPYSFNVADIAIFAGAIGLILGSQGKTS
jgi:signal peptidase II